MVEVAHGDSEEDQRPTCGQEGRAQEEGPGQKGRAEEGAAEEARAREGAAEEGRADESRAQEGRAREGAAQEGRADESRPQEVRATEGAPRKSATRKAPPKKAAPTEAVQAAPLEAAELFEFTDDDLEGITFTLQSDKPDASAFAPGTLVEHDGGKYSLVYSTFPQSDDLEAVYGERGLQGGGHAWRGFVVHLMKQHAPAALEAIEFDPERTMFCAVSKDLAALRAVGAALAQLENVELVVNLARTVNVSDFD